VHLYGQAVAMAPIRALAERHGLAIVEDCCQAHLATEQGQPVGTAGIGGAFSFYPTKNLGALGDGGAIITNDPAVAARLKQLRNGGQADRYHHVEAGVNSRLDEIQAAVLRARLPRLAAATAARRTLAATYRRSLPAAVRPISERDPGHVYHLFPVRHPRRDELQAHLAQSGVGTLVHYPVPLPAQPAFAPYEPGTCPVASEAAAQLLSLPLHPRLTVDQVLAVAETTASCLERLDARGS
jgi:dTDP-4-amino-4,6-dideoxygalactose transaminase